MHVTEVAIHKTIGIQLAAPGDAHILELPASPLLLNHLGTVHAGVQFVLAEACSGEFLLRQLDYDISRLLAVLHTSNVKFCKPAHGTLRASARFLDLTRELLTEQIKSRGRAFVSVLVKLSDENAVVTMTGQYDWFLRRTDSV